MTDSPPTIRVIRSTGEIEHEWRLPQPAKSIITDDCRSAWCIGRDARSVWTLNRDLDAGLTDVPATHIFTIPFKIVDSHADRSGSGVWLRRLEYPEWMFLSRTPSGFHLDENGFGVNSEFSIYDWAFGYNGAELFAVDTASRLWIGKLGRMQQYRTGKPVNFDAVYAANEGHVAWAVTTTTGLYAVDDSGNVLNRGQPLLPDQDVQDVWTSMNHDSASSSGNYAWVLTRADTLYCLRSIYRGPNDVQITVLNDGRPINNGMTELHIDYVRPVGDNSIAWVAPVGADEPHGLWPVLWRLTVVGNQVRAEAVDRSLHAYKPMRNFFADRLEPAHVMVITIDEELYDIDMRRRTPVRLDVPPMTLANIYATADNHRFFLNALHGWYLMHPVSTIRGVQLRIGDALLTGAPASATQLHGLESGSVKLDRAASFTPNVPAHVTVRVVPHEMKGDERELNLIAIGSGEMRANDASLKLIGSPAASNSRFDVELTYNDTIFSRLHFVWRNIVFRPPWYAQPLTRAIFLLIGPIVVSLLLLHRFRTARRWIPVLVPAAEMLAAAVAPAKLALHLGDVAIVIIALTACVAIAAIISPTVFRAVAEVEPYRVIAPFVLQLPRVRRRVFAAYIRALKNSLGDVQEDASDERYVALPCDVVRASRDVSTSRTTSAAALSELLASRDTPPNILIEAAGGRGKSALLNELIRLAIERFENDPSSRLPVAFVANGTSVEEIATLGLKGHIVTAEILEIQLQQGDLLIFVDALTEGSLTAKELETHFRHGHRHSATTICATARPDATYNAAFIASPKWMLVEPQALDQENAKTFINQYAEADKVSVPEEQLDDILAAAKTGEDAYSPILLRFGMLLDETATTLPKIYQKTIDRLLVSDATDPKAHAALVSAARALAAQTYWTERQRRFALPRPTEEENGTAKRLLNCGLLISADRHTGRDVTPDTARFLHDSIQSYLTARWLAEHGEWDCFARAAADPIFTSSRTDQASACVSELLYMCAMVFEPKWRVEETLSRDLLAWSEKHATILSLADVDHGVDELLRTPSNAVTEISAAAHLARTVDAIRAIENESTRRLTMLSLYGAIASRVWPNEKNPVANQNAA
jgi:hypothetical protein